MAVQSVTGAQIAAITDKLAGGLVHDADRAIVPAFHLQDQAVPLGTVAISTLAPQVYATYVAIPVQIAVDGHVAKTIMASWMAKVAPMQTRGPAPNGRYA